MNQRFTLDTNILVYAVDREAGDRHAIALGLVRRALDLDCVLTLQALAEFFRTITGSRFRVAPGVAARLVQQWRDNLPVVAADDACLTDAMDAVTHHQLSFWDAMMWATAKRNGCRAPISEDGQSGRTLGGVILLNPFDPSPDRLLHDLLGQ